MFKSWKDWVVSIIVVIILIGMISDNLNSKPKSPVTAAAKWGNPDAEFMVGLYFYSPNKNYIEGVNWYRKAAEQGDSIAQQALGEAYCSGNGVPKNYSLCYMWLNLAAAQNNSDAEQERDDLEKYMSKAEIAEGQRLSQKWHQESFLAKVLDIVGNWL